MTTEEFWNKYINEDILEIFDETCEFFSKKLPQEFIDNYDVGEVILETKGHQEEAKNFDNVIKFTEIIQNKQPELYKKYFQYFDDFLIDYFCFQQDKQKVNKAFSLFIENPLHDYDMYLLEFKKILFYQHSDLLEQSISKNFDCVKESDNLIGNAEYDLAMVKFYMFLQEIFIGQEENIDKSSLSLNLSKYNFKFADDFISALENGILKPQLDAENIKAIFKNDKVNSIVIIQGYFLRYMNEKGFEFYLSGMIWDKMLNYWQKNNRSKNTTDSYFKIQHKLFEKYLAELSSNMFLDNKPEMIAILWGSVYIYEFFYKINIITEEIFQDFLEISRKLKGKVIGLFTTNLWNSNFVHSWEKPDCISETEFIEENNIFKKSISIKYQESTLPKSSISDELLKIGELSNYIIEGEKDTETLNDIGSSNKLRNIYENEFKENDNKDIIYEPIRTERKVGRNEPCTCGSGKKYKKCCGR